MGGESINIGLALKAAVLGLGTELSAVILAALTAFATAVAAAPVRLLVDKGLQRSQVEIEYEHEQQKALRGEIGKYHGRLLEAALDLNYRLVNLGANWEKEWLVVSGAYQEPVSTQYYFRTTAFRFIRLAAIGDMFERAAIIVDGRIADSKEQAFVRYPKAFRWAMTDVALFEGLDYDISQSSEHFFTDRLRQICKLVGGNAEELDYTTFEGLVVADPGLNDLLRFFDGLRPKELRWDRLMAVQLLLMAFINTFGYDFQRSDDRSFDLVVERIHYPEIVDTLRKWVPKLGLGEEEGSKNMLAALERRSKS